MTFQTPSKAMFDEMYKGKPPWDVDNPQPALVMMTGEVRSDVLDVGCGTGENALYFASKGFQVWGVDQAERAIELAQAKAKKRKLKATFLVHDAMDLPSLDRRFDTVIDSGLFHGLSDEDRGRYVQSLRGVMKGGGTLLLLVFGDNMPPIVGRPGPRRISQDEIRATFAKGWRVNAILRADFHANQDGDTPVGWIASITRLP